MKHTEATANALRAACNDADSIIYNLRPMKDDPAIYDLLNEACQLKNRLQSERDKAYDQIDR